MAVNPQLMPNGTPVPFVNEMMVLSREGVEFQVDKLPNLSGGKWSARGTLYLTSIRMVFVAKSPSPPVLAFDIPLLFVSEEAFNQPIFACNNLSGKVHPVDSRLQGQGPHNFKVLFKEGGVGTFVPVFFNLLRSLRALAAPPASPAAAPLPTTGGGGGSELPDGAGGADPMPSQQPPVEDMIRHAYIDPNDPTKLYLQQPAAGSDLRRRGGYSAGD